MFDFLLYKVKVVLMSLNKCNSRWAIMSIQFLESVCTQQKLVNLRFGLKPKCAVRLLVSVKNQTKSEIINVPWSGSLYIEMWLCWSRHVCVVAVGVIAARDALLTFMVGGTKFDEAKKVLENMGKNIIHCGPVGTGQVCIVVMLQYVHQLTDWLSTWCNVPLNT